MTTERPPIDVRNAIVECCGALFWWKRSLKELFRRAGVSDAA